jgi:hypothetical protein
MGETRFNDSVSKQPGAPDTHAEQVPQGWCSLSMDLRDAGEDERRVQPWPRSVLALPILESLRLLIKEDVNELEGVAEPDDGAR